MAEFWTATAWVISVFTLYAAGWSLIAANEARMALARALERYDAKTAAAGARASEAFSAAQTAIIAVEAMKRSTHTIQMVPVDDVADKALNKGLEQVDDISFQGLGDIDDAAGPLG